MQQTPVHENHNPDLLRMIPPTAQRIIEIGCSSGALAREFKKINPECYYVGVEIDSNYAEMAKRYCDETMVLNIDDANEEFFKAHSDKDCWVFGDTLEHLKDPWRVIRNIASVIPDSGGIAACIPNAQHWSLIIKLMLGDFVYTDSGLLDRTHLRWFTRKTILSLFNDNGFEIKQLQPRVFNEGNRQKFLDGLTHLVGSNFMVSNPKTLETELSALQYVSYASKKP